MTNKKIKDDANLWTTVHNQVKLHDLPAIAAKKIALWKNMAEIERANTQKEGSE